MIDIIEYIITHLSRIKVRNRRDLNIRTYFMILSNVYAMHVGFVHIIDKCRLA